MYRKRTRSLLVPLLLVLAFTFTGCTGFVQYLCPGEGGILPVDTENNAQINRDLARVLAGLQALDFGVGTFAELLRAYLNGDLVRWADEVGSVVIGEVQGYLETLDAVVQILQTFCPGQSLAGSGMQVLFKDGSELIL